MANFTRRDFMRASSAALAASTLARANSAHGESVSATSSPNEKIALGAIGCGGMGRGSLAAFLHNEDVEVAVVCDVDDKQLAEAARLVDARRGVAPDQVKDFRRVIERNDIDAVVVSTPCLLYTSPSPRDRTRSRMPSSA